MSKELERKTLKIICGTPDNPVKIGSVDIECYVLENEMRVLSQRGLLRALGMSEGGHGAPRLGGLSKFNEEIPELRLLSARLASPVEFQPYRGGRTAFGYEATILADICEAVLAVRKANLLKTKFHMRFADQCEMLMRGFARVGIIALVDQATGYDKVMTKRYYEEILQRFITPDLQKWTKTFPDDFYSELFRLRQWNSVNIRKRPGIAGKITVDIIYGRLAPNVLTALMEKTERDDKGRLKTKLFQHLTPEHGHPKLREHLLSVITLMNASPNWRVFYSLLNRARPLYNATLPLMLEYPDDDIHLLSK